MSLPDWFPDWRGHRALVVASGESAKDADLAIARGRAKVLTINNSWQLVPWADALYAGDRAWWRQYGPALSFNGLRIASENMGYGSHSIMVRPGSFIVSPMLSIGHGNNSGHQGLNIAALARPESIGLIGFDFIGKHWHEDHERPLGNPDEGKFKIWRKSMNIAAEVLRKHGITVVNLSQKSTITCFPRSTLEEFLATDVLSTAP